MCCYVILSYIYAENIYHLQFFLITIIQSFSCPPPSPPLSLKLDPSIFQCTLVCFQSSVFSTAPWHYLTPANGLDDRIKRVDNTKLKKGKTESVWFYVKQSLFVMFPFSICSRNFQIQCIYNDFFFAQSVHAQNVQSCRSFMNNKTKTGLRYRFLAKVILKPNKS